MGALSLPGGIDPCCVVQVSRFPPVHSSAQLVTKPLSRCSNDSFDCRLLQLLPTTPLRSSRMLPQNREERLTGRLKSNTEATSLEYEVEDLLSCRRPPMSSQLG